MVNMREVDISEFRLKCSSFIDEVAKTRLALRITRFGKPVAEIIPVSVENPSRSWFGSLEGKVKIRGDIVGPVIDSREIHRSKL